MPEIVEMTLGFPLPQRTQLIRSLLNSNQGIYSIPLQFQNALRTYPVFKVEISLPKYRLSNGRTQASQEEYIANNSGVPEDFFSSDFESIEAQKVQHQILLKMVKNSKLMQYFEDLSHSQEQPIILTDKGFVLNGNRRLCALRELYHRDKSKYSKYSHIDVTILPPCSDKDLDELEAHLQIQPDIKEDYSWISMACMLRARQQRHKYSNEMLSQIYGIKKREVQEALAKLDLVDRYLRSRNQEKKYHLVEDAKHAFDKLYKLSPTFSEEDQDKKEIFTDISYMFIDNSRDAKGRLYERIPEVHQHLEKVIEELSALYHVEPVEKEVENRDMPLLGVPERIKSYDPLISIISDQNNQETIVETVINIVESAKLQQLQRARANAVLNELIAANTRLKSALNFIDENTTTEGIEEQLASIESSIKAIRLWIKDA